MRPQLPQQISRDIDRIRAATWNRLLECLAWAMEHPRGDGATIMNNGDGVMSAPGTAPGAAAAAGTSRYAGPFLAVLDAIDGSLVVRLVDGAAPASEWAGAVACGARNLRVPAQWFQAAAGTLYLQVAFNEASKAVAASAALGEYPSSPGARVWTRRIATVKRLDGTWTLVQHWTGGDMDVLGRWT